MATPTHKDGIAVVDALAAELGIESVAHELRWFAALRLPGGLACDTFSASAIVSVYDALSPKARVKFGGMNLLRGQSVAFKLIEKSRK